MKKGQWIYAILIVFILVTAIDLNTNWRKWHAPRHVQLFTMDLLLGGLLVLLLILFTIKNRR